MRDRCGTVSWESTSRLSTGFTCGSRPVCARYRTARPAARRCCALQPPAVVCPAAKQGRPVDPLIPPLYTCAHHFEAAVPSFRHAGVESGNDRSSQSHLTETRHWAPRVNQPHVPARGSRPPGPGGVVWRHVRHISTANSAALGVGQVSPLPFFCFFADLEIFLSGSRTRMQAPG